ncbi:MAG: trigger factor [Clostridiales bacterium]|nr:trigger factor [Candidatus Apopatocola equi]MCQ2438205.1 trigger factor [Oscillospiraceae bacterium]
MIVNNTNREKNVVTFDVTLDAAEFEKYVAEAYKKVKKNITVPGFRKGKAPRAVVEGMYGKDVFYDDAMSEAAPEAFTFAAAEAQLRTVGQPTVTKYEFNDEKALVLYFSTDVWPEVELGQYKGVECPKSKVEVLDEDIQGELESMQKENGRIQTVERAAAEGDTVVIDFVGTVDGEEFKGGKAEDYSLTLGSGSFVPGFEEQLVGISAGEEKDVNVHFPEKYTAELADKDAVFHVVCHEVKETILPALDDEFAKDNDFDTLEELKKSIYDRLYNSRKSVSDSAFEELIVDKAAEQMQCDIPQSMIEEQLDYLVNRYASYMAAQGLKLEDYLEMINSDMATFRENYREQAVKDVRNEVFLQAVAQAEGIECTEEDMEEDYATLAKQYGMTVEKVKAAISAAEMKEEILHKKAAKFVADNGVAVDEVEEPEEAPAEE